MSAAALPHSCGYACKYAPVALMAGFGIAPVRDACATDDLSAADSILHPNVCSFAKAVGCAALAHQFDAFLFTNCCDSMRRSFDALKRYTDIGFTYMVDLPHCANSCARDLFVAQLRDLVETLSQQTGREFDVARAAASIPPYEPPAPEPYIAVVGARVEPSVLDLITTLSPLAVRDLTCMGAPGLGPVPPEAQQSADAFIDWYADALLSQGNCMRMAAGNSRRELAADPNLAAVIYHGLQFCDFYSYDYQALARQVSVPITRFETDWALKDSGQTLTRIEALIENLGLQTPSKAISTEGLTMAASSPSEALKPRYFAGIDSGSTSTDAVIIDEDCRVVARVVRPTGARSAESASAALDEALEKAELSKADVAETVATGYGRNGIGLGDEQVTEISCHARGARFLDPSCRTIIDIGGQDSKAIHLNEDGTMASFAMNDKCAAGTGRFIEAMARVLELPLSEMAHIGRTWSEDITLTTMCTVFAESEVVSLIAQNKKTSDIVHGINVSVAAKTASLVARVHGEPGYLMTGGVAQNPGVVDALSAKLGAPVHVPDDPQAVGAFGAALIARDHVLGA